MSRDSRVAILTLAIALPASWLWAQQPGLPVTLDQLQDVLKRLQGEVKSLQDTVKQLSKEAKRNKGSGPAQIATSAAGITTAAPRQVSPWQKGRDAYKQALRLEEQRQYRAAIGAYSQAIEADPKSDAAFLHRGYCAYQLGDNAGAIADFSQSLAVQPNNSRAYLARASAYAASGNSANAMADVSEAILRDPRNPESYLLRARLYQQQGEHRFAVRDYTNAADLVPNSEKSYLGRAIVFQADGQPQRALEDCEQAVRVNPNSSAGYLCRAEAYIKMNTPGRAVEEVNRALVTAQTLNQPLPLLNELAQSMPVSGKEVARQAPEAAPVAAVPPVPASPAVNSVAPQPPPPVAVAPQGPGRATKVVPSVAASGSAEASAASARVEGTGKSIGGVFRSLSETLDKAGTAKENGNTPATKAVTTLSGRSKQPAKPVPARKRIDPSQVTEGLDRAELIRRFGEPVLRFSERSNSQLVERLWYNTTMSDQLEIKLIGDKVASVRHAL
jgi:tetratricopeptide (TPR) repeat protein